MVGELYEADNGRVLDFSSLLSGYYITREMGAFLESPICTESEIKADVERARHLSTQMIILFHLSQQTRSSFTLHVNVF